MLMGRRRAGDNKKNNSIGRIHKRIFTVQLILILTLALFLGIAGVLINVHFENEKRDLNLRNTAESIAHSPVLYEILSDGSKENSEMFINYLELLETALDDVDVISVVSTDGNIRLYHSNHELIGTVYDGSVPKFEKGSKDYIASNDSGPSGMQRRVSVAVYDSKGNYAAFVMAIMLMENVRAGTVQILLIFAVITGIAIMVELIVSAELSKSIKKQLLGYEPNVFSAMYQIRDNILESLAEGVIAIDREGIVQFINRSAVKMLGTEKKAAAIIGRPLASVCDGSIFAHTLSTGEKEFNIQEARLKNSDILIDRIPIKRDEEILGAVGILHDRAEYTRLMEDLTGTRYLVDSMRANNHDFTNKLHVILGLIQMGLYDEATAYIENISIVQRATISKIMSAVNDHAAAALLIGKTARAAELNIKFVMREGCIYSKDDYPISSEAFVTVIGNLIENAFEAMNSDESFDRPKELMVGIYSKPGALLITVDDTGKGIEEKNIERIFENGYSTKGDGRGTGLHQVKTLVEGLGGRITVESQQGVGTSFSVSFSKEDITG